MKLNVVNYNTQPIINKILFNVVVLPNSIKKIFIYNPDIEYAMHTFWFHINKCKIIEKKNFSIIMGIPNNENLIQCLSSLDNKISASLSDEYLQQSVNVADNNPITMDLIHDANTCTFTFDDKLTDMSGIKNGNYVSVIIELAYILNGKKYWKIIQIKQLEYVNVKVSLFKMIDGGSGVNVGNQPVLPNKVQGRMPLPPAKNKPVEESNLVSRFMPSPNELLNGLKNLKKTLQPSKMDDGDIEPVVKEEIKEEIKEEVKEEIKEEVKGQNKDEQIESPKKKHKKHKHKHKI